MTSSQIVERVEPMGMLVPDCTLAGESRADGAVPAHPNGIPLSKNRFLILYTTRGFRGRDDEWSGVYRLVADGWEGPLIKEGYLCQTTNDWRLFNDERAYVRQVGHPTAIGVPKGALVNGRRVAHENCFLAMWRQVARCIDRSGHVCWTDEDPEAVAVSTAAHALQFRLNDAEDDIEITQPIRPLRQRGYETGDQICERSDVKSVVKGYVAGVPCNAEFTEWVDMNSVSGDSAGRFGGDPATSTSSWTIPFKYRWNPDTALYEWVACGQPLGPDLFEGSIARYKGSYVIHARMLGFEGHGFTDRGEYTRVAVWCRTVDPFGEKPHPVRPREQPNWFPTCAFTLPDGSLVRIGNCPHINYRRARAPLFLVHIDPEDGFRATETVELRDTHMEPRIHVPLPERPYLDFGKLLPHTGGKTELTQMK